MRILFLNHNVVGSGTFFRAFHFGKELARHGHEVTLVTTSKTARLKAQTYDAGGVLIVEAPDVLSGRARTGWDPYNTYVRKAIVRQRRFDVVHAFDSRPVVVYHALSATARSEALFVMDWADWWRRGGWINDRDSLVETSKVYLPAIRARNFLRHVPLWDWLGQHSYLHTPLNRVLTLKVRQEVVQRNTQQLASSGVVADSTYRRRLAGKLVERIARDCAARGIPFILVDINDNPNRAGKLPFVRSFPTEQLSQLAGATYFDSGDVLNEWRGITRVYRPHGDGHWTPFSHMLVGKRLAELVSEKCVNEGRQGGALCEDQQHAQQ